MCRITVFSTTNIAQPMRKLFMDRILLTGVADYNFDGVGMTDGWKIMKSQFSYLHNGQLWLDRLDPEAIWMGHVRAASKATEVSTRASHPFAFNVAEAGKPARFLYCMHNGFVKGMPAPAQAEPQVDSYQAFKMLAELVRESGIIDVATINKWTAKFGEGSQWTFGLMLDGDAYIVRGVREMHWMSINNGVITNTSLPVLQNFKEWVAMYWPKGFDLGKIQSIGEYQLCHIRRESRTVTGTSIAKPAAPPVLDNVYSVWDPQAGEKFIKL